MVIALVCLNVACAVLTFGLVYGFFQRKFNVYGIAANYRYEDYWLAGLFALAALGLGPILLGLTLVITDWGKYGLQFLPMNEEDYHK